MLADKAAMAILLALFGTEPADPSELFCLAQNIWFEADHSPTDRLAVAHVTLNRVEDPGFPDDVCSVVWQPWQFSWTRDGKSDRVLTVVREDYVSSWRDTLAVAADALAGGSEDPTFGATHYHAPYVQPYWSKGMTPVQVTSGHIFYVTGEREYN